MINNYISFVEYLHAKYKNRVDIHSITFQKSFPMFDCSYNPPMNVQEYYDRLLRYTRCETVIILAAWCYLDKLLEKYNNLKITKLNFHRLFSQSLNLSMKVWDDYVGDVYINKLFFKIIGYNRDEYEALEIYFTKMLNYEGLLLYSSDERMKYSVYKLQ